MNAVAFFIETNTFRVLKDISFHKISRAINRQRAVYRLKTLRATREKAVQKEVACKKFFMTNFGKKGTALAQEHNQFADEFNDLKFWWQKPIRHI